MRCCFAHSCAEFPAAIACWWTMFCQCRDTRILPAESVCHALCSWKPQRNIFSGNLLSLLPLFCKELRRIRSEGVCSLFKTASFQERLIQANSSMPDTGLILHEFPAPKIALPAAGSARAPFDWFLALDGKAANKRQSTHSIFGRCRPIGPGKRTPKRFGALPRHSASRQCNGGWSAG